MQVLSTVALAFLPAYASAVSLQSASFLGNYTTNPANGGIRDLGFVGEVNGKVIATFGDTFQCSDANTQSGCGGLLGANSAGYGKSATAFSDVPNSGTPSMFCKYFSDEDPSTHGMGITTVIPASGSNGQADGTLYFLNIRRNLPNNVPTYAVGAGVAHITFGSDGNPICTRQAHNWWDGQTEPWYGDKSAFLDSQLAYVYALGGCNSTVAGADYRFVSRVPINATQNLNAHQYWNGQAWTSTRIKATSAAALKDTTGAYITNGNQGQIQWNKYLSKYIWLDNAPYLSDYVRIRTADNAQGPWTTAQDLFSVKAVGGCQGSGVFYTPTIDINWYSGDQTFVVHVTCSPNFIQSFKVTIGK